MEQRSPKRIVLNRETVRDLSLNEMDNIEGGGQRYTSGKLCDLSATGDPCRIC